MPRPALSATRAVAVLDLLAAHPREAFTLTDVAARLGVNVASTHAVLAALADAGYLVRHPRTRAFTLGPAVAALGTAALETHPAVDLARDAARRLAHATGLEVAVTTVAGDDIVWVATAGEPTARGVPMHVGQHVPFKPPIGSVFAAWGRGDQWAARAKDPEAMQAVLHAVRARGYSVALEADARKELGHALDELARQPSDQRRRSDVDKLVSALEQRDYQVRELVPSEAYDVSMIAAPVFGADGSVLLAITLVGFPSAIPASVVAEHGERLRDVALVVTRRSRGRVPSLGAAPAG